MLSPVHTRITDKYTYINENPQQTDVDLLGISVMKTARSGESAYPNGLGLSPQGKVLLRQDSCYPRWGQDFS